MSLQESYVVELAEIRDDCTDSSDHLTPPLDRPGSNFRILLAAEAVDLGYQFIENDKDTPQGQVRALVFHERSDGDPWEWIAAERLSDTEILMRLRTGRVNDIVEKIFFDIRMTGPCGEEGLDPVIPGTGTWKS